MSGNEIKFSYKSKEIKFVFDDTKEVVKKEGKVKRRSIFKEMLNAIEYSDNKKGYSKAEFELLKKLRTIFDNTGANNLNTETTAHILDEADIALIEEWKKDGKENIESWIEKKLKSIQDAKVDEAVENLGETDAELLNSAAATESAEELVANISAEDLETLSTAASASQKTKLQEGKTKVTKSNPEVTQKQKLDSFNKSMQALAERKYGAQKEDLKSKYTYEVESPQRGVYLSHIAKDALVREGNNSPTQAQINDRIAIIALINDIEDVNNIPASKYPLKVGTGTSSSGTQEQGGSPKVKDRSKAESSRAFSSNVKSDEIAYENAVKIDKPIQAPEGKAWDAGTPVTDFSGGISLADGASVKQFQVKEGSGDAEKVVAEKFEYTYSKDDVKVKFEASTKADLEAKIKTFQDALTKLNEVQGEDANAKATRLAGAIDAIKSIGSYSAVEYAQSLLSKEGVSADYKNTQTIAMIKSMDKNLITKMFGENGENFKTVVAGNPEAQKLVGEIFKELDRKFEESTITLNEQAIRNVFANCVGKEGVAISEEAAQEASTDEAGKTTPAKEKVFAKTMKTNRDGSCYYEGKVGGDTSAYKDYNFKSTDPDKLNNFLRDLENAEKAQASGEVTAEQAKAAAIKAAVEKVLNSEDGYNDPELLKSVLSNSDLIKDSVDLVRELVKNSNLDVIYSIKTDKFGAEAKPDIEGLIRTKIEDIMKDEKLRALPENAKYLDKIQGVEIPSEKAPVTIDTNINEGGWTLAATKKYTLVDAGYMENNADGDVEVKSYTKDGKTIYKTEVSVLGKQVTLEASSAEELLKQKQEIESLNLETDNLDDAKKSKNLDILRKMVDISKDKELLIAIAAKLKSNNIDQNDPAAKALVQKLLLTRDADIVENLILTTTYGADNTLFVNDPVALKTLAAMYKEIRDKEKLPNPNNRLTAEEVALKDVLMLAYDCNYYKNSEGQVIHFDDSGLYKAGVYSSNYQLGRDFESAWESASTTEGKQAVIEKFLNDPRVKNDEEFLSYLVTDDIVVNGETTVDRPFNDATLAQQKAIIELIKDNAYVLFQVDLSKLAADETNLTQIQVKEAYAEAAKELFQNMGKVGDTDQLDPANARFLSEILEKIDGVNVPADANAEDPDKAVIAGILDNFFVTEGEAPNQTVKIKDFRRFTYIEMSGLAEAVEKYGTDLQKAALANMITLDEMEDGQFVRAIELDSPHAVVQKRYAELADAMTTKEEVLDFISKMEYPHIHIPFDKIMEKFANEPEVVTELLKNIYSTNIMSDDTRKKLLDSLVVNGEVKIPDGVVAETLYYLLPQEVAASDSNPAVTMDENAKKVFNKIVESTTDVSLLKKLYVKAGQTVVLRGEVGVKVSSMIDNNDNPRQLVKIKEYFPNRLLSELLDIDITKFKSDDEGNKEAVDNLKAFVVERIKPGANVDEAQVRKAFENGWLDKLPDNNEAVQYGRNIFSQLDGPGSGEIWAMSQDETMLNKDTIIDILDGFIAARNESDPQDNDSFIKWMRDDGVPAVTINRYIKALMRKAVELKLDSSSEYIELKSFFENNNKSSDAKLDDPVAEIFRGSEFDDKASYHYDKTQVDSLNNMVDALLKQVKFWTGRS